MHSIALTHSFLFITRLPTEIKPRNHLLSINHAMECEFPSVTLSLSLSLSFSLSHLMYFDSVRLVGGKRVLGYSEF